MAPLSYGSLFPMLGNHFQSLENLFEFKNYWSYKVFGKQQCNQDEHTESSNFCQTSVEVLRLEVHFVLPLSQEQQEQEEEEVPPPNISIVTDPILIKF